MLTEIFLTYGQSEPPAELVPLRAGPLRLLYDPANGMVRRIQLGEREVLRGIYAAARDRNWGTVPGVIRETAREIGAKSFRIELESDHQQGEIRFVWRGTVSGKPDGVIRYEFDGEARRDFFRNRIGFCVLHPIAECAGARARQTRTDGSEVECRFPDLIEPQIIGSSSFQQLRAVAHEVTPGVWAEVILEGDTFEMEDQRNWTDASFKTYCTPLALPFPVEIKAGSRIQQAVTLRLASDMTKVLASAVEIVSGPREVLTLAIPDAPTTRLPVIGLGVASHGEPLNAHDIGKLRQLRLSHFRVDLRLATESWRKEFQQAASGAEQLEARLEVAIHLPRHGDDDFSEVTPVLERQAALLARVLALREGEAATSSATLQRVRKLLRGVRAPVGAGSDCNFCELNREQALGRLALNDADFLFWSINPQVHTFDHLSIMETLEAQAATVRSARAFAGGRPLVVTPVTLKQRFNPVATRLEPAPPPGELPPQVDPRQLSQFAAAWTLGSLAALVSAGVESVTYYETTGWRGVMERAAGSSLPEKFHSLPGELFPVGQVLSDVAGCSHLAVVPMDSPKAVFALALFAEQRMKRLVLANCTDTARDIQIASPTIAAGVRRIPPYGVARFEMRD